MKNMKKILAMFLVITIVMSCIVLDPATISAENQQWGLYATYYQGESFVSDSGIYMSVFEQAGAPDVYGSSTEPNGDATTVKWFDETVNELLNVSQSYGATKENLSTFMGDYSLGLESYMVHFTGTITAEQTGTYTFVGLQVDNGCVIKVNGNVVYEYWGRGCWFDGDGHRLAGDASFELNANEAAEIEVYFLELNGGEMLDFQINNGESDKSFEEAGISFDLNATTYRAIGFVDTTDIISGIIGKGGGNQSATFEGNDNYDESIARIKEIMSPVNAEPITVDTFIINNSNDFRSNAAMAGCDGNNGILVEYTGYITADEDATYSFGLTKADNGCVVEINGQRVIEYWGDKDTFWDNGEPADGIYMPNSTVEMQAGESFPIHVVFLELNGEEGFTMTVKKNGGNAVAFDASGLTLSPGTWENMNTWPVEYNSHYYQLFNLSMTWPEAKEYCENLGGHLVTITTAEEQSFVETLMAQGSKYQYWIGLTTAEEPQWITGESFSYSNWDPNDPDNHSRQDGESEDYVHINNKINPANAGSKRFKWNDMYYDNNFPGEENHFSTNKVGFICEWKSSAGENYKKQYDTVQQYMADVILNYNYAGCLKNYDSNTPHNITYNYIINPKHVSLSRVHVDLLNQNDEFINSVKGWEILTFSPTDIYQDKLDEIGYYEAILFSILDYAVEFSIIPSSVEDSKDTASDVTEAVMESLKFNAQVDYDELKNMSWDELGESAQQQAIEAAGKNCKSLSKLSEYQSVFFDILSTAITVEDFCEKIASLEQVSRTNEYVSMTLDHLYESCPTSNSALKEALDEVRQVCKGSFEKSMVYLLESAKTGTKIVADIAIEQLWTDLLASLAGGYGMLPLVGQLVGKSISNFLFSTDAIKEQFYVMKSVVAVEDVLVSAVQRMENTYNVNGTIENANIFLTSLKMLFATYSLSCDYAEDYVEIVKTSGLVNGIKSIFSFGNEQEYAAFCETCNSIKESLSFMEMTLTDPQFGYVNAINIDDNALYNNFMKIENDTDNSTDTVYWKSTVITVACPTNVDIYQDDSKVLSIVSNEIVGIVPGVIVYIDGDVKHIVLPADSNYSIQITGYDEGTMNYTVSEYDNGSNSRDVVFKDVSLVQDCSYNTSITENLNEDFVLVDKQEKVLVPDFDSSLLTFSGASLTLQDNLAINYKVSKSLFEESGYTNPYVKFVLNDVETVVTKYSVVGDNYVFDFTDIAPHMINDTVYATLYATYNGVEYASATREYSVATYCYNMLGKYTTEEYAELQTLLVDLLNYGSKTQEYLGYQTDNLANAQLTEEQVAWGTSTERTFETLQNTRYEAIENPTVLWKGAGLMLQDSITMRFKIAAESVEGLSVKVICAGGEWTVPSSEFELIEEGSYYVYFDALSAAQMSEPVYLAVYKGDTAVSHTVRYSVESYAYAKQNDADTNLVALIRAMMQYGDSSYAYVN